VTSMDQEDCECGQRTIDFTVNRLGLDKRVDVLSDGPNDGAASIRAWSVRTIRNVEVNES
jgi:hypothetical protein